jgi:TRAP-type C4-dicarboxylate transport system permease small subunit
VLLTAFAAIVAWYVWKLALESFTTDARAMSILRTPLFVPQTCMALGFTLLAVQGAVIFFVGASESLGRQALTPPHAAGGGSDRGAVRGLRPVGGRTVPA